MKTRFKELAENCGICFEGIDIQGELNCCSHLFCLKCIKKWSDKENSCPVCKKRFKWIRKVFRRKEYRQSKSQLVYVQDKNQGKSINSSELILMLQAASSMLTSNLQNLLEFHTR